MAFLSDVPFLPVHSVNLVQTLKATIGQLCKTVDGWTSILVSGTVRVFKQDFALEDAIGSHACSLEALTCV
jgi:hypothetical protein